MVGAFQPQSGMIGMEHAPWSYVVCVTYVLALICFNFLTEVMVGDWDIWGPKTQILPAC